MTFRMHILGVPHAVTHRDYSTCAFSAKVLKLCKMMMDRGHIVYHYGNELSDVQCTEHVTVTTAADLEQSYPGHDFRTQGFAPYKLEDRIYQVFYANTIAEIHRRKQPGDFLLCPFGAGHKAVADAHADLIVCESGIGYSGGTFAPYKVYESYAALHALEGRAWIESMSNTKWYDVVIPNAFDLADFEYRPVKDNYFLFLGRIGHGKGSHIAAEVVKAIGGNLIVAGMGGLPPEPHIVQVGVAGPEKRKQLLAGARAVFCASTYLEPFCGVQIEAMLSGTPVISTDWGAFAEYNLHGVTGYRCRTFEQFCWAARNIERIKSQDCRNWAARNFSLDRIGAMYESFFWDLAQIHNGNNGWYAPNPERMELDWLRRWMPGDFTGLVPRDPQEILAADGSSIGVRGSTGLAA